MYATSYRIEFLAGKLHLQQASLKINSYGWKSFILCIYTLKGLICVHRTSMPSDIHTPSAMWLPLLCTV